MPDTRETDQLFAVLDKTFAAGWRDRLDSDEVKAAIEAWIDERIRDAVTFVSNDA